MSPSTAFHAPWVSFPLLEMVVWDEVINIMRGSENNIGIFCWEYLPKWNCFVNLKINSNMYLLSYIIVQTSFRVLSQMRYIWHYAHYVNSNSHHVRNVTSIVLDSKHCIKMEFERLDGSFISEPPLSEDVLKLDFNMIKQPWKGTW